MPHARYWSGLLLALFMVIGVPLCLYGGLARGEIDPWTGTSNSNEEHDERFVDESSIVARKTRVPPPAPKQVRTSPPRRALHVEPRLPARLAIVVHPSRFSERRLI